MTMAMPGKATTNGRLVESRIERTRRGFTLIELLVVLVIVALLAGISYAAYGPARESARQTKCMSNLRQIGQALRMYIDDYGGIEPIPGQAMGCVELGLPTPGNRVFLKSYVKNRQVLFCPSYHGKYRFLATSYMWGPEINDSFKPLEAQFAEVVRKRGGDTPINVCDQHNPDWDAADEPRWVKKRILVLRLNGRVDSRLVPIRSMYPSY